MFIIIPTILSILYFIKYRNNINPPLFDIISPCITLSLIVPYMFEEHTIYNTLIILTLITDSLADFYMDENNVINPLILFSLGHVLRQLVYYTSSNISFCFIILSVIIVLIMICRKLSLIMYILLYALLVECEFLGIYFSYGISIGCILFVISDLMIGFEILICRIKPRWVRVLIVPSLYWLSEIIHFSK